MSLLRAIKRHARDERAALHAAWERYEVARYDIRSTREEYDRSQQRAS